MTQYHHWWIHLIYEIVYYLISFETIIHFIFPIWFHSLIHIERFNYRISWWSCCWCCKSCSLEISEFRMWSWHHVNSSITLIHLVVMTACEFTYYMNSFVPCIHLIIEFNYYLNSCSNSGWGLVKRWYQPSPWWTSRLRCHQLWPSWGVRLVSWTLFVYYSFCVLLILIFMNLQTIPGRT